MKNWEPTLPKAGKLKIVSPIFGIALLFEAFTGVKNSSRKAKTMNIKQEQK